MTFDTVRFWCRQPDSNGTLPAFPVDPAKDQTTAKSWANQSYYVEGWPNQDEPISFDYPNWFGKVVLVDLECRNEGGRAYKVEVHCAVDGRVFLADFREQELLDVIRNTGIQPGGRLGGAFTFVKLGSQTRLTRIGSPTQAESLANQERTAMAKLKPSSLVPYRLYAGKDKYRRYLYLQEVWVPSFAVGQPDYNCPCTVWRDTGMGHKRRLFVSWCSYQDFKECHALDRFLAAARARLPSKDSYAFVVPPTVNFYEDLGEPVGLPHLEGPELWDRLRREAQDLYGQILPRRVPEQGYDRHHLPDHPRYPSRGQVEQFVTLATCAPTKAETNSLLDALMPQIDKLSQKPLR
jgi:hypothetical protein